jgi:hypothetical protein
MRALVAVAIGAAAIATSGAQTTDDESQATMAQGQHVLDSLDLTPIAGCEALHGEEAELCEPARAGTEPRAAPLRAAIARVLCVVPCKR